jgi:hypothetical protein
MNLNTLATRILGLQMNPKEQNGYFLEKIL